MNSRIDHLFYSVLFFISFASLSSLAAINDINRIYRQTPNLSNFEICYGRGCAQMSVASLTHAEWDNVARLFMPLPENAGQEREKIALAIGVLEDIVGHKVGTTADKAGTFVQDDFPGQLDCNDESINTTTYMRLLGQAGLMRYHVVEDTRTRNFFFTGWPHTTAVMRDAKTGERFAVDSWFFDNGHPAVVVPFLIWKDNFYPKDSPVNR